MKAVRIHAFGGPEVLVLDDVQMPKIVPGELLVRIGAASINPVDYKIRQGGYPKVTQSDLPIILGRDICGVVEEVSSDSDAHQVGDEVFSLLESTLGGYAQFIVLPASICAPKPATLDTIHSAAVPLAGLTAWQGLFDQGGLDGGQSVLIHAGSGGVGHLAIQFAKARGAHVITTASKDNLDFVKQLGADIVIDYKAQPFEDVAKDVDVVFDLLGGKTRERSWQLIKKGGIMVSTLGQPDLATAAKFGVRAKGYIAQPSRAQLVEIRALIDAGKVKPTVTKTFTLAQGPEAHRFLEQDHPRGKIVLDIGH